MPNIGPVEIIIVLFVVLVIFGPKRLPELGRSMGRGMREFKDSITGKDEEKAPEITAAQQQPAPAPTPAAEATPAPPAAPRTDGEPGQTQVAEPSGVPTDRT